jgi:hypothetical protein
MVELQSYAPAYPPRAPRPAIGEPRNSFGFRRWPRGTPCMGIDSPRGGTAPARCRRLGLPRPRRTTRGLSGSSPGLGASRPFAANLGSRTPWAGAGVLDHEPRRRGRGGGFANPNDSSPRAARPERFEPRLGDPTGGSLDPSTSPTSRPSSSPRPRGPRGVGVRVGRAPRSRPSSLGPGKARGGTR